MEASADGHRDLDATVTRLELMTDMRGFLNEAVANYFTDAIVGLKLNQAYHQAQAKIRSIDAAEFRVRSRISIAVGADGTRARYPRATYEPVVTYRILDSTSGKYRDMDKKTEEQLTGDAAGSANRSSSHVRQAYFVTGAEIVLVPEPTANLTNGIECEFWDPVSLTAAGDNPRMPVALHPYLAFRGAWLAVQDTKDAGAEIVRGWDREWQSVFGSSNEAAKELARFYPQPQGIQMIPDVRWPGRTA